MPAPDICSNAPARAGGATEGDGWSVIGRTRSDRDLVRQAHPRRDEAGWGAGGAHARRTVWTHPYGAAGPRVSRQEEVNSTERPVSVLVLVGYVLAQVTLADPHGTVAAVMSWIPPFSSMLMPLRIASGTTSPLQIVGSAVLMLLATAALAVVAARIYERSVLRTGKRVSWSDALRSHA